MDFLSTTRFQSKLHPDVNVTIRVVTIGRRMEFLRAQGKAAGDDLEWRVQMRTIWEVLVKDFEGVTVDGVKPSVPELFLEGPEDLIDEISTELVRQLSPVGSSDSGDEAAIATAKQQIAEAEIRIAARKNSEPQSSGSIPEAATLTAANAKATEKSESDEIAMVVPI
jgi:hypothetical protein